jgi:hypothetical protein
MMVQIRDHAEHLDDSPVGRPMTCEEFQARMPELLGDGIREHQHLKTCARCAALLDELEYIARIASDLLLPVYEPGESVWRNINASISKPIGKAAEVNGHLRELPAKG